MKLFTLGREAQQIPLTSRGWERLHCEHPIHGHFRDDPHFEVKALRSLATLSKMVRGPLILAIGTRTRTAPFLDAALKALGAPRREIHVTAFLPFPSESVEPGYLDGLKAGRDLARSLTTLDGRLLVDHWPERSPEELHDFAQVLQGALLEDLRLLLRLRRMDPRRKCFRGDYTWLHAALRTEAEAAPCLGLDPRNGLFKGRSGWFARVWEELDTMEELEPCGIQEDSDAQL